jgi:hypothetical protein
MDKINCFKAYDIRGKVPEELNSGLDINEQIDRVFKQKIYIFIHKKF